MIQPLKRHPSPVPLLLLVGLAFLLAWTLNPLPVSSQAQDSPLSPLAPASPLATVAPAAPPAPASGTEPTPPAPGAAEGPVAETPAEGPAIPEGVPRRTSPSMVLVGAVLLGLVFLVVVVLWRTRTRSRQG